MRQALLIKNQNKRTYKSATYFVSAPFLHKKLLKICLSEGKRFVIVSDTTVRGGFPPLLLNPVDFQALYMERFKDEIEAAQKTAVN